MNRAEPESDKGKFPRWTVLSVAILSSFMVAVDTSIVSLALPAISKDLPSGVSLLGWVVTGYVVAVAIFLLQSGRLGDRHGRKRVYLTGFAFFGVASALCGLSTSIYQLIAFRVLQGAAASVLTATTTPLIFESFPPSERGSAVGLAGTSWSIGALAGPVLGGFLVSIDWRLVFYINVPITAAAILLGARRIPSRLNAPRKEGSALNVISSVSLALSVASVMITLTFFDILFAPLAVVGFVAFVLSERRSKDPLIHRELRRSRGFLYSAGGLSLQQIVFLGLPFAMSFYFQTVLGYPSQVAGLALAAFPLALIVINPTAGWLFDRVRIPAKLPLIGLVVGGTGVILLAIAVELRISDFTLSLFLALVGFGSGLVWSPTLTSMLRFSKAELRGAANGVTFMLVDLGYASSVAMVISVSAFSLPPAAVAQIYLGSLAKLTPDQAALFHAGIANALAALGILAFAIIPIFVLVLREQLKVSAQHGNAKFGVSSLAPRSD